MYSINGIRILSIEFLEPSPELAYIIGVVAGDGWVSKEKRGGCSVGVSAKDRDFTEEFSRCLGKVLGRGPPRPRQTKNGVFIVSAKSKVLYELLQKPIEIDKIQRFVEHCKECMRSFLRGFFDSEGGVEKSGRIFCCNTDLQLLQYVQKILNILGIRIHGLTLKTKKGAAIFDKRSGKIFVTKKNIYILFIRMSDVLRFYQLIGFTIQRKQKRLEEYLKKRRLL